MVHRVSNVAFIARLEGLGFKVSDCVVFSGLYFEHTEFPKSRFGGVLNSRTMRRDNRATLAHLEKCLQRARDVRNGKPL